MQKIFLRLTNNKEYSTEVKELSIGIIKKFLKSIDLEKIMKNSKTDEELIAQLTLSVIGAFDVFENYLVEIFKGLTIEELEEFGTPSEIANTLIDLLNYTAFKISGIGEGLKNLTRGA